MTNVPSPDDCSLFSNPVNCTERDADTLREECGIFGVFNCEDAAALTALGLAFTATPRTRSCWYRDI